METLTATLAKIYYIFYDVDLVNDTFVKFHASPLVSEFTSRFDSAYDCLQAIANAVYVKEDRKAVAEFYETPKWSEELKDKDTVYIDARGILSGWIRTNLIVAQRDADGNPTHVYVAIQNVNEAKTKEMEHLKQLEEGEKQLEDINCELESSVEEAKALNEQLQENQARLEEATAEQEAQLEEISALNARLEAEQEAKAKESRVVEALSSRFTNVYLVDRNNRTLEVLKLDGYVTSGVSKDATKIYPYDAVCNRYVQDRVYKDDALAVSSYLNWDNMIRCVDKRVSYEMPYRVIENNEIHYYQGSFISLDDGFIVAGFQNIDDTVAVEKRRNEELAAAKRLAEAANNAKTSFLFNMSHDIRTPMNAIIGFRDLLEKHQEDPVRRADYLEKIANSSKVLLSIINNVLEMARIEKGTVVVDETLTSAKQCYDTLHDMFIEMMEQKNLKFTYTVDIKHDSIFCDITKMREVFINIISNACKYTNPGGSVTMKVEELPSDRRGFILLRTTISDTGIGMSEEFLPHVFEEFSREQTSRANKIEGTGLGMPIVKRLVEILSGTIEVQSKKGVGTTFVVTVPHRIAADTTVTNTGGSSDADPEIFKGKHILLAEDNDLNAEIATEILCEAGFVIERAEDGKTCCQKLADAADNYYDVILMDIQMPNMNGYEATKVIRAMKDTDKARIPIIAMTANAFEEDKREAIRSGMNGHVAKPIDVAALMKELANVLR